MMTPNQQDANEKNRLIGLIAPICVGGLILAISKHHLIQLSTSQK